MAKPIKSDIVSDMMRGTQIVKAISDALRNKGGDDSVLLQLLDPQSPYPAMIADMLMPQKPKEVDPKPTLLGPPDTLVTLRPMEFAARDKFKKGGDVNFYGFWGSFEEWFLGKVEKLAEPADTILRYQTLLKGSVDGPIITELGGEVKSEMSLAEIWNLLKRQANGEEGVLLTNGYANLFYVKDVKGVLRTVRVRWHVGGWYVFAYSVEGPSVWYAGDRVFSRNS